MADAHLRAAYAVEPDFASRQATISAIMWLAVAASFELFTRALLLVPELGDVVPFLSYGRIRAIADTVLVFGWLSVAGFAAIYALLPRTSEAQLHNEVLGAATIVMWNLTLFAGIAVLLVGSVTIGGEFYGFNQGRPLAELPIVLDAGLLFLMLLVVYNAAVTTARRRERVLFVSSWYLLAAALLLPIVFVVGNVPVFGGVVDAIVSGFYLSGLEFLWLVPIGLGIAYYVIPVETGNAVHSMRLARVGFWTLMFAGGWAGQRYFVGGPGPDYLEAIGVGMTAVLLVPVLSAVSNLYATTAERWGLLGQAFGLRWACTALGLLVFWVALLVISSVPSVARIVALTSWAAGLRHLAFWGVFSGFGFALIYRTYPLLVGRGWWSSKLASLHYWATVIGVGVGLVVLLAAGIFQGTLLQSYARFGAEGGLDAVLQFGVNGQRWFQAAGLAAFAVVAAAQYAFVVNAFRTARTGPPLHVSYAAAPVPAGSPA